LRDSRQFGSERKTKRTLSWVGAGLVSVFGLWVTTRAAFPTSESLRLLTAPVALQTSDKPVHQLDLWDALASERDAARWEASATEEDRFGIALTLVCTAAGYYELAELNQRIALGEQSIVYARKTVDLVKGQATFGAASKLEIAEAEQSWESQQATQTELLEQRIEARNALTVLLNGVPF
jgi:hypothetical protein